MLGREVCMPVDLLVEPIPVNVPTATTAYAQNLQDKLVTAYEIARENTSSSVTQVGSCGSLCGRVCDRMADTGGKERRMFSIFVTKKFENAFARSYQSVQMEALEFWVHETAFQQCLRVFSDFQSSLLQVMSSELFLPG